MHPSVMGIWLGVPLLERLGGVEWMDAGPVMVWLMDIIIMVTALAMAPCMEVLGLPPGGIIWFERIPKGLSGFDIQQA